MREEIGLVSMAVGEGLFDLDRVSPVAAISSDMGGCEEEFFLIMDDVEMVEFSING